jgi:hypothetical protein
LAAIVAVYCPTLQQMVNRWPRDPQYTHGYVVPLLALIVLWFRRDSFPSATIHPSWWGIPFVLLGTLLHLTGTLLVFEWLSAGSIPPILIGLILLAGGPALLTVLRDVSRLPANYGAEQRLEALGIRVLGAVVISEKTETYGHAIPYPRPGS